MDRKGLPTTFFKTYKSYKLLQKFARDFCENSAVGIYDFHFDFFDVFFAEGRLWRDRQITLFTNNFLIQVDKDESLYLSNDEKSLGYWVYRYFRNSATINDIVFKLESLVPNEEYFFLPFTIKKGNFLIHDARIVFQEKIKLI